MARVILFLGFALFFLAVSAQKGSKRPSKKATKGDGKIVGGVEADFGKYSYIVSLQEILSSGNRPFCAGSIISSSYILTAAHCTVELIAQEIIVVAGTADLRRETATTQRRRVRTIINHPGYDPRTSDNDVALIRLDTPLQLNNIVKTVELDPNEVSDHDYIFVAGWGRIQQEIPQSLYVLKATAVPAVSRNECQRIRGQVITNNMICAGFPDGGNTVCSGDSGGPAVSFNSGKQVGIVSFGTRPCGTSRNPDVYANVARYIPWIRRETGLPL